MDFLAGAGVTFTPSGNSIVLSAAGGGGALQLTGDITAGPGVSPLATTLKNTGTAGTYTKTTFDAQGRETSGSAAALASADYANQGTTITLLHGNAAGNPSWGAVNLATDVSGSLPASAISGVVTNTSYVSGGATNQVYTQTGWSGDPSITNLYATNISLRKTTSSTSGVINQDGVNWMSTYKTGNLFLGTAGESAGNFTLSGLYNLGFGRLVFQNLTSGQFNIGFGSISLKSVTTGSGNMAVGSSSLTAITAGSDNIAIGTSALQSLAGASLSPTSYEVAIGASALINLTTGPGNTAIGRAAGASITSGSYNTFIGYGNSSIPAQKVNPVNSMALGANTFTTADNQVVIGNATTQVILTGNVIATGSSTATNGFINYGTGWAGTTNTAPFNALVIVGWVNYTNTTGGIFKMPLYQ